MRKIVVGEFISLDGVIQAPGTPEEDTSGGFKYGGWVVNYFDQVMGAVLGETLDSSYDLLLGRKTYDIFAAHWPVIAADPKAAGADEGDAAIAKKFEAARKYVATHSHENLTWDKSESLGSDVVARLKELKQSSGPFLLVQGSGNLVQTLLANDLVDEFRLLIFPIVLGKGKRLYGENSYPSAFKLTKSVTSPNGVICVTLERSGEIKTGSFGLADKKKN